MTAALKLPVIDQNPDYDFRGEWAIAPGLWKMRNGHIALIERLWRIPYGTKTFPVWVGRCVDCNESKTWNVTGTYAAAGIHANDLMGPP